MKKIVTCLCMCTGSYYFAQTYTPITVSGFNIDAVAETYPNSLSCTTQALDQVVAGGNSVMYNAAFASAASFGGGLPNSGTIVNAAKTFQLMPYNVNNALFVPSSSSNTLTLATPASYSNLSFLVFSTEGSSTINIRIFYTDLTVTNVGNFTVQDWFNGTGAVISGIGRCKRVVSGVTADGLPTNPRLYGIDVPLTCVNQQKQVASVVVNGVSSNPAGGGGYVLAVSGVTVNMTPPTIAYGNLLCQGGASATPTLTGATGGSYASGPAGLSLTAASGLINLVNSTPATYTVTYSTTGACPLSGSTTVVVLPSPVITANSPTVCPAETATLTASGASTYTWTGSNLGATNGTTVTAQVVTPGVYTITGTDLAGCTGTGTTSISIKPPLVITANTPSICPGETATLTASGASTYTWTGSNLGTTSGATVTAHATVPGTYTVTATNQAGCMGTNTTSIFIKPLPDVTVNSASVCPGEAATLNANASLTGGTYSWFPGNQNTASITEVPVSSGSYTVVYTLDGCSDTATTSVTIFALSALSVNSGSVCPGETIILTASTSIGGGTFSWLPGAKTTSSVTEAPEASSSYTVQYVQNGCSVSTVANVHVFTVPDITLAASALAVAPMDEISVTASGSGTYVWNTGATGPVLDLKIGQSSTFCATITSVDGCKNNACIDIVVKEESTLYVPNAFTPNGDDINDEFHVASYNLSEFDLKIFNRWGQLLFQTNDPLKGWDGSFKGQTVAGVYVFILKAKGNDGSEYRKSGHITLLQ